MIRAHWLEWPSFQKLVDILAHDSGETRAIGGCVRDALRGIEATDIDIAVTHEPDKVMQLFHQHHHTAIPTGIDFGTVTVVIDGQPYQVTTLRRDINTDGRYADVIYTKNWHEDAQRRDFTINTLSMDPEGQIYDYHDGRTDLKSGIIRFVGDAQARIQEDYLRLLRLFRFYAYVGKTPMDASYIALSKQYAPQLTRLSAERITGEMLKILAAPNPISTLTMMHETGILSVLTPRVEFTFTLLKHLIAYEIDYKQPICPLLRLACLLYPSSKEEIALLAKGWRLSNAQLKTLTIYLMVEYDDASFEDPLHYHRLFRHLPDHYSHLLLRDLSIAKCNSYTLDDAARSSLFSLPHDWEAPIFPLSGSDLKALGVPQGKLLGDTLKAVENYWEEQGYKPSKQELLLHAEKWITLGQ